MHPAHLVKPDSMLFKPLGYSLPPSEYLINKQVGGAAIGVGSTRHVPLRHGHLMSTTARGMANDVVDGARGEPHVPSPHSRKELVSKELVNDRHRPVSPSAPVVPSDSERAKMKVRKAEAAEDRKLVQQCREYGRHRQHLASTNVRWNSTLVHDSEVDIPSGPVAAGPSQRAGQALLAQKRHETHKFLSDQDSFFLRQMAYR